MKLHTLLLLALMALVAATAGDARAASAPMTVRANVLSNNVCKFRAGGKTATLDFGNLDPMSGLDRIATTSLIFKCTGAAGSGPLVFYGVSDDDGLYETAPNANRMRHSTILTQFIHYTLTYTGFGMTIKNVDTTVTFTGKILGADYAAAAAGPYRDTVVVLVVP